jgi:hypothetical protein
MALRLCEENQRFLAASYDDSESTSPCASLSHAHTRMQVLV